MTIYGTDQISGVKLDLAYSVAVAGVSRGLGVDTIPFALGQKIVATDESVWLFCLVGAGGITGASYVCMIDEAFTARMTPSGLTGAKLGVAACAATAGQYCWIQMFGVADVQAAASCDANVLLYTTTTPGVLDDDDASGYLTGIVLTTANGIAQAAAPGLLNWSAAAGAANALDIDGDDTLALTVDELMTPEVYTATGGVPPYSSFTVSVGTLPAGLTLSSGGTLSGTPTEEDVTDVTIAVSDQAGTIATLPIEITVAGAGYVADAVVFAAQDPDLTALIQESSAVTGSALITISYWMKIPSGDNGPLNLSMHIDMGGNPLIIGLFNDAGPLDIGFSAVDGSAAFTFYSVDEFIVADAWGHMFFAVDMNHASGARVAYLYYNGSNVPIEIENDSGASALVIPWTGATISIPDRIDIGNPPIELSDYQVFSGVFADPTNPANLAKFIDADGKPVDPAIAAAEFGQQTLLFSGDSTGFATNQGTGGAFTLTGSLTNATTSPSD